MNLIELSFVVKPHLSAFHLNIRSLNGHFSELIELLDSIPFAFDFMAFFTGLPMANQSRSALISSFFYFFPCR